MRIVAIDWLLAKRGGRRAGLRQPEADERDGGAAASRFDSVSGPGRAWINGRETGGADLRYAHLSGSHD
jgi:hypothetical protein